MRIWTAEPHAQLERMQGRLAGGPDERAARLWGNAVDVWENQELHGQVANLDTTGAQATGMTSALALLGPPLGDYHAWCECRAAALPLLQCQSDDSFQVTRGFIGTLTPYAILSHMRGNDNGRSRFKDIDGNRGRSENGSGNSHSRSAPTLLTLINSPSN